MLDLLESVQRLKQQFEDLIARPEPLLSKKTRLLLYNFEITQLACQYYVGQLIGQSRSECVTQFEEEAYAKQHDFLARYLASLSRLDAYGVEVDNPPLEFDREFRLIEMRTRIGSLAKPILGATLGDHNQLSRIITSEFNKVVELRERLLSVKSVESADDSQTADELNDNRTTLQKQLDDEGVAYDDLQDKLSYLWSHLYNGRVEGVKQFLEKFFPNQLFLLFKLPFKQLNHFVHVAAELGHLDILSEFDKYGADLMCRNKDGLSCFDIACQHDHAEVAVGIFKLVVARKISLLKSEAQKIVDESAAVSDLQRVLKYELDVLSLAGQSLLQVGQDDYIKRSGELKAALGENFNKHFGLYQESLRQDEVDACRFTTDCGNFKTKLKNASVAFFGHFFESESSQAVETLNNLQRLFSGVDLSGVQNALGEINELESFLQNIVKVASPKRRIHAASVAGEDGFLLQLSAVFLQLKMNIRIGDVDQLSQTFSSSDEKIQRRLRSYVNEDGEGLMHLVAKGGNSDAVKLLVELGFEKDVKDCRGNTPFLSAVSAGHLPNIEVMHTLGFSLGHVDELGHSAIHLAAIIGSVNITNYLIGLRPDFVTSINKQKMTALHLAAIHGHSLVIKVLLDHEVDPLIVDSLDMCAIHYAAQSDFVDCVTILHHNVVWSVKADDVRLMRFNSFETSKEVDEILSENKLTGQTLQAFNCWVTEGIDKLHQEFGENEKIIGAKKEALRRDRFKYDIEMRFLASRQDLYERMRDKDVKKSDLESLKQTFADELFVNFMRLLAGQKASAESRADANQMTLSKDFLAGVLEEDRDQIAEGMEMASVSAATPKKLKKRHNRKATKLVTKREQDLEELSSECSEQLAELDKQQKEFLTKHTDRLSRFENCARQVFEALIGQFSEDEFFPYDIINPTSMTIFHVACRDGLLDVVKHCLENETVDEVVEDTDDNSATVLHLAAENGHVDVARLLCQRRTLNINAKTQGYLEETAGHIAARLGYVNVLDVLLDAGADLALEDGDGRTPVQVAAYAFQRKSVIWFYNLTIECIEKSYPSGCEEERSRQESLLSLLRLSDDELALFRQRLVFAGYVGQLSGALKPLVINAAQKAGIDGGVDRFSDEGFSNSEAQFWRVAKELNGGAAAIIRPELTEEKEGAPKRAYITSPLA